MQSVVDMNMKGKREQISKHSRSYAPFHFQIDWQIFEHCTTLKSHFWAEKLID